MKLALIGYGKMGKEIETIAVNRGHKINLKIGSGNLTDLTPENLNSCDAAIEFSTPQTVLPNLVKCLNTGIPVVVGTTGWYDHFERITSLCKEKNGALLYATNFSLGVNLFFKVNSYLAGLMNKYPEYEVTIEEIHHIHKLDKPSGTAITLSKQIIDQLDRKNKWSITDKSPDTVFIKDVREGAVPGTHIIRYESDIDNIEIMHKAHNRRGFALGAVIAAEFLMGKKGIYSMDDVL